MGNDFQNFQFAYPKIQEDMERLNRLVKPSYLNIHEQMEQVLEPIRSHYLEVTRAAELSGLASSKLAEIACVDQWWQDVIDQVTAASRVFEDLEQTHKTRVDALKPMEDTLAQLQPITELSFYDVKHLLTVTERLLAGVDFESLRRAAALPDFKGAILDVTSTYGNLAESIRMLPEVSRLPEFALSGATREIFTTGYALDTICVCEESKVDDKGKIQLVAEVEQDTSCCMVLLQKVDPALARPYIGARDALHSRNADKTRHILASLRELWNHLLRRLAPDDEVKAWIPKDNDEYLYKGQPTRKARILYVCRDIHHAPLSDFLVQDTRALLKLVELFNRVHKLNLKLTEEQLRALFLRSNSWLVYILQIWEMTR